MGADFDWRGMCNAYLQRTDISAKGLVDEIAKHDDHIPYLLQVIEQIQTVQDWQNYPKLRELERQCRLKIQNVTGMTPNEYPRKVQDQQIEQKFKRTIESEMSTTTDEAPPQSLRQKRFKSEQENEKEQAK